MRGRPRSAPLGQDDCGDDGDRKTHQSRSLRLEGGSRKSGRILRWPRALSERLARDQERLSQEVLMQVVGEVGDRVEDESRRRRVKLGEGRRNRSGSKGEW